MREIIKLACTEDKKSGSVYMTTKNKKKTTERLELKKYNKKLRRHTLHRESKA
jgi:large subunit ribosomal protein L33